MKGKWKKDSDIRPLEEHDREQWQYIWGEYLRFYETKLPLGTYSRTFSRLIDNDFTNLNCLVAHSNDTCMDSYITFFIPTRGKLQMYVTCKTYSHSKKCDNKVLRRH